MGLHDSFCQSPVLNEKGSSLIGKTEYIGKSKSTFVLKYSVRLFKLNPTVL